MPVIELWPFLLSALFVGVCLGLMLAQVWGPGHDDLAQAYRAGFEEGLLAGANRARAQYVGGALKLVQRSDA